MQKEPQLSYEKSEYIEQAHLSHKKISLYLALLLLLVFSFCSLVLGIVLGFLSRKPIADTSLNNTSDNSTQTEEPLITYVPATDDTSDWPTYSNDTLGFSFKYPKGFAINEPSDQAAFTANNPLDIRNGDYHISIYFNKELSVSDFKLIKEDILSSFLLFYFPKMHLIDIPYSIGGKEIFVVDSYIAYIDAVQADGGDFSFTNAAFIDGPHNVIEMDVSPKGDDYSGTNHLLLSMLSTIKFGTADSNQKTYTNNTYGISLKYPKAWLGPQIYEYTDGFLFAVGTDVLYPYGTSTENRIHTKKNSYQLTFQVNTKPANQTIEEYKANQPWLEAYGTYLALKDGESLSNARSLITRVKNVTVGNYTGIEYIETLSETAETEMMYTRKVILIDTNYNTIRINGNGENVEILDKKNWKSYYQAVDEANLPAFEEFVHSISINPPAASADAD